MYYTRQCYSTKVSEWNCKGCLGSISNHKGTGKERSVRRTNTCPAGAKPYPFWLVSLLSSTALISLLLTFSSPPSFISFPYVAHYNSIAAGLPPCQHFCRLRLVSRSFFKGRILLTTLTFFHAAPWWDFWQKKQVICTQHQRWCSLSTYQRLWARFRCTLSDQFLRDYRKVSSIKSQWTKLPPP